jgi:hypothetical protein
VNRRRDRTVTHGGRWQTPKRQRGTSRGASYSARQGQWNGFVSGLEGVSKACDRVVESFGRMVSSLRRINS